MKIGFIGLGIMGLPMAKNLINAGHELVVRDNNTERVNEVVAMGATVGESAKAVAEQVQCVITMVPDSPQVLEVALGEGGIIEGAHEGLVYIDMSSIAPLVSRQVHDALAEVGVPMLDAPVSGGEPKAIDGTLSIMVGGAQDVFDAYSDVLGAMGGSVVRVGEIGAGNIAKLCNQVVVAINIAAVSEALVLAQKAGVDPEAVYQAIRGGLAGSTVMDAKAPMMLDRNFNPGFRIGLHIKDLNNVMATSHAVQVPLPLASQVLEMMINLQVQGSEREDHSALVKFYENLAQVEISRAKDAQ